MEYAKIIVKSDYEKRGDLVLRSYIRALKKVNGVELLDGDNALLYGMVDEFGNFYEFFTKEIIDFDNYEIIPFEEYIDICFLPKEKKEIIKKVIKKIIFEKNIELDMDSSTIRELAIDRLIEFQAYNNYLSRINPFTRLDDQSNMFAYNSFQSKLKEIKKMAELDEKQDFYDEYDIVNYENISKRLVRK